MVMVYLCMNVQETNQVILLNPPKAYTTKSICDLLAVRPTHNYIGIQIQKLYRNHPKNLTAKYTIKDTCAPPPTHTPTGFMVHQIK